MSCNDNSSGVPGIIFVIIKSQLVLYNTWGRLLKCLLGGFGKWGEGVGDTGVKA